MERRLPVIVEGLIITVIIFVLTFGCRFVSTLAMPILLRSGAMPGALYSMISSVLNSGAWLVAPVIASLVCIKAIENRRISLVKVILIPLGVGLVVNFLSSAFLVVGTMMGDMEIVSHMKSAIDVFFLPLFAGILITLFLNLFSR